jgi:hypothetical protein
MWSITGWIHSKHRNRVVQPTVEKVAWDSPTTITEPDEQGVDDVDEEDSTDEQ